jgi:Protein of unknown function (DUF2380)
VRVAPLAALVLWCATLAAQSAVTRPTIAVINLRFDGEHANVLGPGDTAIVAAATSRLLATLRASEAVTVVDSATVAAAVARAEADGNACDNPCAVALAGRLGARWVAKGSISNLSGLVWQFGAELFDVTTGQPVLVDGYEIKGDPARMAPIGAHMFAQRVEKKIKSLLH